MFSSLWQVFWINLATPSLPFIFPLRLAITAGAVDHAPWWLVLLIANAAGAFGLLPVYALARWKAADTWHRRLEQLPSLHQLRRRCRSNMFLVQILLNAVPLPDLVSAGLAGCERYPVWRLLLAQLLGRSFHNLPLVLGTLLLTRFPWFHHALQALQHPVALLVAVLLSFGWWLWQRKNINDRA